MILTAVDSSKMFEALPTRQKQVKQKDSQTPAPRLPTGCQGGSSNFSHNMAGTCGNQKPNYGTCALFISFWPFRDDRFCLMMFNEWALLKHFKTHIAKLRGSVGIRPPGPSVKLWVCILLELRHCVVISFTLYTFIFIDALIKNIFCFDSDSFPGFHLQLWALLPLNPLDISDATKLSQGCHRSFLSLFRRLSSDTTTKTGEKTRIQNDSRVSHRHPFGKTNNPFKSKLDTDDTDETGTVLQYQEISRASSHRRLSPKQSWCMSIMSSQLQVAPLLWNSTSSFASWNCLKSEIESARDVDSKMHSMYRSLSSLFWPLHVPASWVWTSIWRQTKSVMAPSLVAISQKEGAIKNSHQPVQSWYWLGVTWKIPVSFKSSTDSSLIQSHEFRIIYCWILHDLPPLWTSHQILKQGLYILRQHTTKTKRLMFF